MENLNSNTRDYSNNSKNQVDKHVDKLGEKIVSGANQAADKLDGLAHSAKDAFENASSSFSKGYGRASKEVKRMSSQFEGAINENPLVAIGVAAGLGWALGRYLSSRSSATARRSI